MIKLLLLPEELYAFLWAIWVMRSLAFLSAFVVVPLEASC
jgi:hypothetical protein